MWITIFFIFRNDLLRSILKAPVHLLFFHFRFLLEKTIQIDSELKILLKLTFRKLLYIEIALNSNLY